MKFKKFGKAFVMAALSAGIMFGVSSCIQSYSTGYIFVTGTATAGTNGEGIISGFKINHNTGQMTAINGLPIPSGGANPVRAVLISASRFVYVLNRGTTASGGSNCTSTDPCINSNITQFAVGGNGSLTPQQTFYTQGKNPFRIVADGGGNYLYVLDHDSLTSPNDSNCSLALGNDAHGNPIENCGDVTAYSVNQTTGRLSVLINAQASATLGTGQQLAYFPVPANPVDFAMATGSVTALLTLNGSASTSYPYSGGTTVFPYAYVAGSGQLTLSQNTSQSFSNFAAGTAIVYSGGYVYLLDNEAPAGTNSTGATSQILPFTVGTGGSLNPVTGGPIANDATLNNPVALLTEAKNKWVYVANYGSNNTSQTSGESGISGFVIDPTTHQLSFIAGEPFGSGSGPVCIVEDPSGQYVFTANYNDASVTGRLIDQASGVLDNLRTTSTASLDGPATWCFVSGRTN